MIMMMICVRIVIVIISTKHAQKVIALSDEHSLSVKEVPTRFNCQGLTFPREDTHRSMGIFNSKDE